MSKQKRELNFSQQYPNDLDTDFRFEVIAAALIERGYTPEQIRVIREGIGRRGVSKDVESVYRQHSPENLTDCLCIKVNREGLYDMLPEGLFHTSTYKRSYKDMDTDTEKALDEIKIHREQEFFARKFFHVFEVPSDRILIDAYFYEARYDRKVSHEEFVDLFVHYWPLLKELEHKQAVFFLHIIPILHQIRVDLKAVEEALSYILAAPVRIEQVKVADKKVARHYESQLDEAHLGVDFVLDNTFDDGEYDLKLIVGPISADRMRDFLETAPGYRILEELCTLFFSVNLNVVKEFKIDPADCEFILSDDTHSTYLGINSFI